ncbi:UvrD-helicase domain-containing protein [Actinoplanes bogorensis]|uniref:UvrD-helicase domain-containing protein n=1 Tax=Paractinoplanes bogorensis TaxID=1610840 RepID=A0ABS5YXS9_9ACTN|nr:UvrD-helicase domain-containing protein [Actinoplanes bogorensis]MBU2668247.1 UvrD-helicase domain-containing protein [Actinoplanes bogorensis]
MSEILAAEQKYFDHVSDHRERMRRGLLDAPAAAANAGAAVRLRKDAEARLARIGEPDDAVAVGRMDDDEGETLYVGYQTIFDDDSEVLVVNWQAPAAARYYTATHADAAGLVMKRSFETNGNTISSYEDVVFRQLAAAVAELEGPDDALLEDLNRDRTGQMHDIVRTIQAAQFDLIRAPLDEMLIIQGGPGTGKTAVALHRVSWLLYNFRDALAPQDVLIVGPNPTFTRYTRTVLPSLGDTSVAQRDIGQFHPAVRRGRLEDVEVVRLKGDGRMAGLLRRALYDRVGVAPDQRPIEAQVDGRPVVFTADEINEFVARSRQTPGTFAQQRQIFRSLMVNTATERARERRLGVRTGLDQLIERLWPSFRAPSFLRELFGSRGRLLAAAGETMTDRDITLLHRRPADRIADEVWSDADLPLLDYLDTLINGLDERYRHIVVDEAQDLSPMQLRSIAMRSATGSMTVVGDIAQSTGLWARDDWDDVLAHLPAQLPQRIEELRYGYRVPRQVFEIAAQLLPFAAPDVTAPQVVRDGPADPVFRHPDDDSRAGAAVEAAMAHASHGRSVAIICPAVHRWAVEAELTLRDVAWRAASRNELGQGVNLVSPQEAKGLEFDATVVVEPRDIIAEDERGHRLLYVALTRTTRYLHVVGPLPTAEPPSFVIEPLPAIGTAQVPTPRVAPLEQLPPSGSTAVPADGPVTPLPSAVEPAASDREPASSTLDPASPTSDSARSAGSHTGPEPSARGVGSSTRGAGSSAAAPAASSALDPASSALDPASPAGLATPASDLVTSAGSHAGPEPSARGVGSSVRGAGLSAAAPSASSALDPASPASDSVRSAGSHAGPEASARGVGSSVRGAGLSAAAPSASSALDPASAAGLATPASDLVTSAGSHAGPEPSTRGVGSSAREAGSSAAAPSASSVVPATSVRGGVLSAGLATSGSDAGSSAESTVDSGSSSGASAVSSVVPLTSGGDGGSSIEFVVSASESGSSAAVFGSPSPVSVASGPGVGSSAAPLTSAADSVPPAGVAAASSDERSTFAPGRRLSAGVVISSPVPAGLVPPSVPASAMVSPAAEVVTSDPELPDPLSESPASAFTPMPPAAAAESSTPAPQQSSVEVVTSPPASVTSAPATEPSVDAVAGRPTEAATSEPVFISSVTTVDSPVGSSAAAVADDFSPADAESSTPAAASVPVRQMPSIVVVTAPDAVSTPAAMTALTSTTSPVASPIPTTPMAPAETEPSPAAPTPTLAPPPAMTAIPPAAAPPVPATPSVSAAPLVPVTPLVPVMPSVPAAPLVSATSSVSGAPSVPVTPLVPVAPSAPAASVPAAPVAVTPSVPVAAPVSAAAPATVRGTLSAQIVEFVATELANQVRDNLQPAQWQAVLKRVGELLTED